MNELTHTATRPLAKPSAQGQVFNFWKHVFGTELVVNAENKALVTNLINRFSLEKIQATLLKAKKLYGDNLKTSKLLRPSNLLSEQFFSDVIGMYDGDLTTTKINFSSQGYTEKLRELPRWWLAYYLDVFTDFAGSTSKYSDADLRQLIWTLSPKERYKDPQGDLCVLSCGIYQ
ncbi:MAG: hypothetical protein ABF913_04895 [Oenococcus sp.]|uniref:hypothetical protein n=1 Tax=Oenococcus sp. TaxID=1979414 RepID=UPI0039EA3D55